MLYLKIMEYYFQEFTIQQLIELIDKQRIDLNPSYQRNFIWKPEDQMSLIDSILQGFPLPSFFVYERPDGFLELVDGQQRTKTIFKFVKGELKSSKAFGNVNFSNSNQNDILNYKLSFITLKNLLNTDSLNSFYVLINKKGVHLNTSEIFKSEYSDKLFMQLSNEVLTYQNLINLNLFTEASTDRMNDRSFVEELLVYLKLGIKDKKKPVEAVYNEDISTDEYSVLLNQFTSVIDIISEFNKIYPISKTRYKQKNDFYTLFNFINENIELSQETLNYQYEILLLIDGSDPDGKQFIRPTNDKCQALKEYANNCVTQTNSKSARENRLEFFNAILKNVDIEKNEKLVDVLNYIALIYGSNKIELKSIDVFNLVDISLLKKS